MTRAQTTIAVPRLVNVSTTGLPVVAGAVQMMIAMTSLRVLWIHVMLMLVYAATKRWTVRTATHAPPTSALSGWAVFICLNVIVQTISTAVTRMPARRRSVIVIPASVNTVSLYVMTGSHALPTVAIRCQDVSIHRPGLPV
jgi:hypothetical protein